MYHRFLAFSYLLLSFFVTLGLTPAKAEAPRTEGDRKVLKREVKRVLTASANSIKLSYQQFQELRQSEPRLSEKLAKAQAAESSSQQTFNANKQLLDQALTALFELRTEELALLEIAPYQSELKQLQQLFLSQSIDSSSPLFINAFFLNRRTAMSSIIQLLANDIGRVRALLNRSVSKLQQTANSLEQVSNSGNSGFYSMTPGALSTSEFIKQLIANYRASSAEFDILRAYIDGKNLAGEAFSPVVSCSPSSTPFLFDRFDDLEQLANISTNHALFMNNPPAGPDYGTVILEPYFGNASTGFIGRVSSAQACASTLVNDINFLTQEITNSLQIPNLALADNQNKLLEETRRLFERRALIAEVITAQPQILSAIANISASVSNTQNGTHPNAWRSALRAAITDYELLNSFHPRMYRLLEQFSVMAEREVEALDRTFEDNNQLAAEYRIVAAKLRAIMSGGMARMDEQLVSSRNALNVLAQDIASGELPLLESINTWFLNTDLKASAYQSELTTTLPTAIHQAQTETEQQRELFNMALAGLSEAKQATTNAQLAIEEFSDIRGNVEYFFQSLDENLLGLYVVDQMATRTESVPSLGKLVNRLNQGNLRDFPATSFDFGTPLVKVPTFKRRTASKRMRKFNKEVTEPSLIEVDAWVDALSRSYLNNDSLSEVLQRLAQIVQ